MEYIAAVYQGNSKIDITSKQLPKVNDNDVLIKVQAATICGTDVHILHGDYDSEPPVVLGHEYSGIVVAKGESVSSINIGDLVTVEPHKYCGVCKYCRIGKEHLCLEKKAFGVHLDGGFAQYSIVPDKIVYKVPSGLTPTEAALTENIGCCLHGIDQAGINLGDDVVIIGGGFVGIVLAELSRLRGAGQVIVIEPNENRQSIIKARGFEVLNPFTSDITSKILEMTNNLGADVVIEAAGRKETAQQCFELVGRGGTILFFGVVPPNNPISITPNDIYKRELKIVGSAINPFSHHRSLQIMKSLHLRDLVTHQFPLEDIEKAIGVAASGEGIKVVIHPNGDVNE